MSSYDMALVGAGEGGEELRMTSYDTGLVREEVARLPSYDTALVGEEGARSPSYDRLPCYDLALVGGEELGYLAII